MTYEFPDWPLEAQRIGAAFGVEDGGQFEERHTDAPYAKKPAFEPRSLVLRRDGIMLGALYTEWGKSFKLSKDKPEDSFPVFDQTDSTISFNPDYTRFRIYEVGQYASELAHLLFNLNVLAPEIEAALGVSAHQKLEWTLKRDERIQL